MNSPPPPGFTRRVCAAVSGRAGFRQSVLAVPCEYLTAKPRGFLQAVCQPKPGKGNAAGKITDGAKQKEAEDMENYPPDSPPSSAAAFLDSAVVSMSKASGELPRFLLDLLSACPRSGGGVHSWLFTTSRQLWAHRSRAEQIALLSSACADCGRDVPAREVEAAIDRAQACAWRADGRRGKAFIPPLPPAPKWPGVDTDARAAVVKGAPGLADLWEASPIRFNSGDAQTEEIIDALFPGNPLLCTGKTSSIFDTCPRESWRGRLAQRALIVPSPMSAVQGLTKDGRPSKHTLNNTGPRRFLVVEFDTGPADEHAAILWHLGKRAPLVLAVHSGGKSLHGWFFCAGQPEDRLRYFFRYAVSLGADPATWTRSQFVRMPDGQRDNGKRQTVYFYNPEPVTKGVENV